MREWGVGRFNLRRFAARTGSLERRVHKMKAKTGTAIQRNVSSAVSRALTRRSLLAAAPALSALPLAAGLGQPSDPGQQDTVQNRPVYKLTPHIEAFYKASRY